MADHVKGGVVSTLGYVFWPDWHTPGWLWLDEVVRVVPYEVAAGNPSFQGVLATLRAIELYIPGARSRIVFWFDG